MFWGRTGIDAFAIYTVPPEGGEPRRVSQVGSDQRWLGSFSVAPDGSRMAFSGWVGPIVSLQVLDIDAGTAPRRMFYKTSPGCR